MSYHTVRMGQAIQAMLVDLNAYCHAYRANHGTPIGEDYVLGEGAKDVLLGMQALLNGELGRKDGATLDRFMRAIAKEHGIEGFE